MMQILKLFYEWAPEIVNNMNNCSHHLNAKNLNPYHVEGSVWTHTVLMYKGMINYIEENKADIGSMGKNFLNKLAVCILCHDVGKIYCRDSFSQPGKVSFYGHNFYSIQDTIDFIFFLEKNGIVFNNKDILDILTTVSNHMDFFGASDLTRKLLSNNDKNLFALINWLHFIDKDCSLNDSADEYNELYPFSEEKIEQPYVDSTLPQVYIYCGPPGVGKDTTAHKHGLRVVSYDDARLKYFKEKEPISLEWTEAEIYQKAWEYSNKERLNLNNYIKECIETTSESCAICNTNLSRKARNSIQSLFKNRTIHIVYLIAPSETIFERNIKRTYRNIDKFVIQKNLYNQQIPSLFDFRGSKNKLASISLYKTI